MSVIGARRGRYKIGGKWVDTISHDALFVVTGVERPEQPALDMSTPPLTVSIVAGPWLDRFRGNWQILSYFGDVRRVAAIPSGKTPGLMAQSIGLALQQRWRELASYAEVHGKDGQAVVRFQPFTRSYLLNLFPSGTHVEDLLRGNDPNRTRRYWNEAIGLLEEAGVIGSYRELEPLPAGRQGWQKGWLDQPLDIRPARADAEVVAEIAGSAKAARRRQKKRDDRQSS
jgi:hypothetical protein